MPETPPAPKLPQRPPQQAYGCLITAGLLIGPIVGLLFGQVTAGLLGGFALGVLAATVLSLRKPR